MDATSYQYDGESNPHGMSLPAWQQHIREHETSVDWTDKDLAQITRLRLVSDPGFPAWDVSYCYGVLKDGTKVRVGLPFSQLPKRWKGSIKFNCAGNTWGAIKWYAKKDGVNLWNLKAYDALSKLI